MYKLLQKIRGFISHNPVEIFNTIIFKINNQDKYEKFATLSLEYEAICKQFIMSKDSFDKTSIGYDWGSWAGKIRQTFHHQVPMNFLAEPLISFTMVFKRFKGIQDTKYRLKFLKQYISEEQLIKLLEEDCIGNPIISNFQYKTSSNRAYHLSHLAMYKKINGNHFWDTNSVIEFGGGYGNMCRLIKKANPLVTYIIIDLPELLALQYVYLASLIGENELNIINEKNIHIASNKINLISSEFLYKTNMQLEIDSFISTWALSESPYYLQEYVVDNNFFNAKKLLLASLTDENNLLKNIIDFQDIEKINVPLLKDSHEYWIR